MSQAADVDVLVVGAGPVGLTLAGELARHGVSFRIVDRSPEASDTSKALVLWSRSLEMLHGMDAVEPFLAAGQRVRGASLFAGGRRLAHIAFRIGSPYDFALMIPQSETERLLGAHLARFGGRVERGVELTGFAVEEGGVVSTLRLPDGRAQTLRSAWLAGCDGAHSCVRHGVGAQFEGSPEPNDWILADVRLSGAVPNDEVSIFFHSRGVLLFLPIAGARFRVVADAGAAVSAERPADPSLEDVVRIVGERGPGGLVLEDPTWLAAFRIQERKVAAYRHGSAFLAGDAAHIHSPAGGQGMNTGMQDAYNLAWKLALVTRGRGRDVLLDSYGSERGAVGDLVLRQSGFLTRAATLRNPVAQHVRNHVYGLLASLDVVQQKVSDTISELSVNYRGSPIVGESWGLGPREWLMRGGVAPGERAPDGRVRDGPTGAPATLFEILRGTRHTLLLFQGVSGDDASILQEIARAVESRYPSLFSAHLVVANGDRPMDLGWTGPALVDPDAALHKRYAAGRASVYLIRPDGYVGYRSQPADADALLSHLSGYLVAP